MQKALFVCNKSNLPKYNRSHVCFSLAGLRLKLATIFTYIGTLLLKNKHFMNCFYLKIYLPEKYYDYFGIQLYVLRAAALDDELP